MNRRELLQLSGAAGVVAVFPNLLNLPLLAQSPGLPQLAWPETPQSQAHHDAIIPLVKRVNANPALTTLTADEWDALAIHHQYYHGMHNDAGHLRAVDAAVKANQAYLKTKFNPDHVNMILNYGTYSICMRGAGLIHETAQKLRTEQHGRFIQEGGGGRLVEAQYYNYCAEFFGAWGIVFDIIALFLAPEIAIFFTLLAIFNASVATFGC